MRTITQLSIHLLPPVCLLCGDPTHSIHNLCLNCRQELPILPHHCPQCARFLSSQRRCERCLKCPPPFTKTHALFPYKAPLLQLIHQLKFQHKLSIARLISSLFLEKIQTHWYIDKPLPDVIIPIPLHRARLCARGFNQVVEIAKPLARTLHIPLHLNQVIRRRATQPQTFLKAAARKKNIAHAFLVEGDYKNLTVSVIDDVITTGHTIRECCRLLKQKGAKQIDVWCCARRG